jgi:hypothetical protein
MLWTWHTAHVTADVTATHATMKQLMKMIETWGYAKRELHLLQGNQT